MRLFSKYTGIIVMAAIVAMTQLVVGKDHDADAYRDRQKSRHYYLAGAKSLAAENYAEAYELFHKAYLADTTNAEAALEYAMQYLPLAEVLGVDSLYAANALDAARPLVKKYPSDFFPVYDYALLREHAGSLDEAIEVMERFHELNPGHTQGLEALTDLYLDNQDFDHSLSALDEYKRIEGEDIKVTLRKAGIYLAKGDTLSMIDEARHLISTNPAEPQYWVLKGQLEQYVARSDSAIASYNRAEQLSGPGGGGPAKIQLSQLYKSIGDSAAYDQKVYEALLADDLTFDIKKDLIGYYLGNQMRDSLDSSRGDKLLDVLLEQYPHEPELLILSAGYNGSKKDYAKALEEAEYCIDLDPVNEEYRSEAMRFAYFAKDYDAIDRLYADAVLHLSPLKPATVLDYAQLLLATEQTEKALTVLEELMARDFPGIKITDPLDTSKLDKSITMDDITELISIYQNAGDAYSYLDKNLSNPDLRKKIFLCYDNVLTLAPEYPLALNNYAYFLVRGKEDVPAEDLAKALEMSERAEKGDPSNPTYMDTRAWVLYRAGDFEGAKEKQEAALEAARQNGEELDAEYYDHMGDILSALGLDDDARKYWQMALDKEPGNKDIKSKLKTK